jgi:hypothetical protein
MKQYSSITCNPMPLARPSPATWLQVLPINTVQVLPLFIRSVVLQVLMQCPLQAAVSTLSSPEAHGPSAAALQDAAVLSASITDSVEREHIMMVRLSAQCRLSRMLVPLTVFSSSARAQDCMARNMKQVLTAADVAAHIPFGLK